MNDQLQTVLAELFKQASSSVGSIIDFGKQEIPELVREFLWYNGLVNVLSVVVAAVIGTILCRKLKRVRATMLQKQANALEAYKNGEKWTRFNDYDEVHTSSTPSHEYNEIMRANPLILTSIYYVIATVSTVVALWYAKTACLILVAPRLYLVQVAMDMYKNIH